MSDKVSSGPWKDPGTGSLVLCETKEVACPECKALVPKHIMEENGGTCYQCAVKGAHTCPYEISGSKPGAWNPEIKRFECKACIREKIEEAPCPDCKKPTSKWTLNCNGGACNDCEIQRRVDKSRKMRVVDLFLESHRTKSAGVSMDTANGKAMITLSFWLPSIRYDVTRLKKDHPELHFAGEGMAIYRRQEEAISFIHDPEAPKIDWVEELLT